MCLYQHQGHPLPETSNFCDLGKTAEVRASLDAQLNPQTPFLADLGEVRSWQTPGP